MKIRLLALAIGSLTLSAGVFAQDKAKEVNKDAVREIDAKVPGVVFARNYQLLLINAEVLPKVISNADDQARLKKQVDFTKEQLILFAWSSAGGDKLTYTVHNGGKSVIFHYDAGLEKYKSAAERNKETGREKKPLKSQFRAFAIPKDASWLTPGWPYVVDPWTIPKLSSPR
jgi:hypothetical protein